VALVRLVFHWPYCPFRCHLFSEHAAEPDAGSLIDLRDCRNHHCGDLCHRIRTACPDGPRQVVIHLQFLWHSGRNDRSPRRSHGWNGESAISQDCVFMPNPASPEAHTLQQDIGPFRKSNLSCEIREHALFDRYPVHALLFSAWDLLFQA